MNDNIDPWDNSEFKENVDHVIMLAQYDHELKTGLQYIDTICQERGWTIYRGMHFVMSSPQVNKWLESDDKGDMPI
tara:strand:- start:50013 stop:50240 length:228 start_codon:yes stop_codon:yes gene_type:complete